MSNKFLKFFWVILLVLSSFCLGYYLKPTTSSRAAMISGGGSPFSGRQAPALNFRPSMRR